MDAPLAQGFDPEHLELILLPTERCNFRCTYCYEDFSHGKMRRPVVDAIKMLLAARTEDLRSLHLNWFGGEPLLARDIVLEINRHAKAMYAGKTYFSSITTNGYYLDADLFCALIESGLVNYQISLDGPERIHNQSRVTIRGNGTFDTIWRNLLATRDVQENFTINLRLHVGSHNCEEMLELVDQIVAQFGHDGRYKVFLKEIVKLGGPNDDKLKRLSPERFSRVLDLVRDRCRNTVMVDYDEEEVVHVCYASRLNSLLIRSDGRIGKCTVAMNDDDNIVGLLQMDGRIELDRRKLALWVGGLFSRNPDQLGCPLSFKNNIAANAIAAE